MAELTQQEKVLTWNLYINAMSGDPTIAIPGCRQLVAILISSAMKLNAEEYEEPISRCFWKANRAHFHYYTQKELDKAMEYCGEIITILTPIITEEKARFAVVKGESFEYKPQGGIHV